LVSALVLEAFGVTRDQIRHDFLLSNQALDSPEVAEFVDAIAAASGGKPLSRKAIAAFAGVKGEWLEAVFDGIAARHRSVIRYLTDHVGIGDRGISRLREAYLRSTPA
jgi:hypothetical protein